MDLTVGAGVKGNTLKPDTIYEVKEYLGSMTLVEIGPSAARTDEVLLNIWDCEVEQIISCYRERWLLTLQEWRQSFK